MKSFEELIDDLESTGLDLNGKEISEYEVGERVQCFINGYEIAEKTHRNRLNRISFQLNRKILKGCQGKDLLQLYNDLIGGFLDDFIY